METSFKTVPTLRQVFPKKPSQIVIAKLHKVVVTFQWTQVLK